MPGSRKHLRIQIRELRSSGLTYNEINNKLGTDIPKSSLSYICRDVTLSSNQKLRIAARAKEQLAVNRQKAIRVNSDKLKSQIEAYRKGNLRLARIMIGKNAKLIALAMLYLGEGAKWRSRRGPLLGSADPKIVELYINLLRQCYGIKKKSMRCRVQHRADQDPDTLVDYWVKITGIEKKNFYPCYVDKRTIGKITKKPNYFGVCTVTCPGTYIQLELEQIADIISEAMRGYSSVG